MTAEAALLKVDELSVNYGPARALFDVSFVVERGDRLALLGPNGAGKSTTGRAISGLVRPHAGTIQFDGRDIGSLRPHQIRRLGVTYLPEGRGIFPGLSVMDNLRMSVRWIDRGDRPAAIERTLEMFPILGQRRTQRASSLSGGEQQMLSIARGLAVLPTLLIADELSLGLAPQVVDTVLESMETAHRMGVTIILIEQYVHRALAACERCVILRQGAVAWQGRASAAKQEVLDRYLGDDPEQVPV